MKILIFTSNYKPRLNGISTYGYEVALALKKANHIPIVLAFDWPNAKPFDQNQSFETKRIKGPFFFRIISSFFLVPFIIKKYHVDVVLNIMWFPCGLISIFYPAPTFIVVHGREVFNQGQSLKKRLLSHTVHIQRWLFNHVDGIFPVSNKTADLLKRIGVQNQNISVVSNGVDIKKFDINSKVSLMNKQLQINKGKSVILTVGRLGKRKGHDNVLRALPKVISKVPNLVYLIAGSGIEEKEIYFGKVISSLISDLQLEPYVKMLGEVNEEQLIALYNACDVFVMPSREIPEEGDIEGFGITYLEANACSKPVIAGRSGGILDAVVDGITGILVNPESPNEIADAIIELLCNRQLREKMGQAGRRRAVSEFQWHHTADKLLQNMRLFGVEKRF